MYSKAIVLALAASPLVAAHGKVAVVTGDAGGNTTALGIMGGIVPGPGPNKVTEVDTTVFGKTKITTDGLGKTTGGGKNTVAKMAAVMKQAGDTLPQVSPNGGTIQGTFHIVTTDGAGPLQAVLDSTATGSFSNGKMLDVVTQVPGKGGNIKPSKDKRWFWTRAYDTITKRAANVNEDFPMKFSVPAGTSCSGTIGDKKNVCLVKIANNNAAGPFGGVVAIQIAADGTATTATKAAKGARRSEKFRA